MEYTHNSLSSLCFFVSFCAASILFFFKDTLVLRFVLPICGEVDSWRTMAKKETSQKKSFYKMFAKSEVNLEDCDKKDKGSARSLKSLFKNDRVKKKQREENVEERSKDSTDG